MAENEGAGTKTSDVRPMLPGNKRNDVNPSPLDVVSPFLRVFIEVRYLNASKALAYTRTLFQGYLMRYGVSRKYW